MIEVTTIGSHAGSQVLGEVCHRLVDVFLWQLFAKRLSPHQSSWVLADFMVLFQHGVPDVIVQWVQIWRVWGLLVLIHEPRTVCLQPVLRDARRLGCGAVLLKIEPWLPA